MICVKCGAEVPEMPFCGACGWKQKTPVPHRTKRGNGQGRVFRRGKSWSAQVTLYTTLETRPDGSTRVVQKRRTRGGFETKKEALAALEGLRGPQGVKSPTLLHYWQLYEGRALEKLSKDKQTAYRIARRRLEDIIGRAVDTLTVADLQGVVDSQTSTYYPAHDMKVLLSHLWKLAMADQAVATNLPAFIILPDLEEKESEPFTEAEVRALWQSYTGGSSFTACILLMIYSGMMPGELLSCQVESIDTAAREIRGVGKKTKVRKQAPIVYPEFLDPVVADLIDRAGAGKLIRRNRDNFYRDYYAALEAAGVRRLPPYACRHTTGTAAARANLAAPIVQNIMRHAKITTTQRYIHLGSQEAHEGINKLESGASE